MKLALFNKSAAPQPAPRAEDPARAEPAHDCAIWNDIARALNQVPRPVDRAKTRGEAS